MKFLRDKSPVQILTRMRRLFDITWASLTPEEKGEGLYETLWNKGITMLDISETDEMLMVL